MKSIFVAVAGFFLLAGQAFCAEETLLKNQKDKVSYVMGVISGDDLKKKSIDVDPNVMMRGVRDALSGEELLLTDPEIRRVLSELSIELAIKQADRRFALEVKNKEKGEAFLAENKVQDGVKTLSSGLQYKALKDGAGKSPKATDQVVVHYRGTKIDGTEFDSSYQRNEPVMLRLDKVIKGWAEALILMKEGDKWQLFIPPRLAYGKRGQEPIIEPGEVLVFEVELISVIEGAVMSTPEKVEEKASIPAAESSEETGKNSKEVTKSN